MYFNQVWLTSDRHINHIVTEAGEDISLVLSDIESEIADICSQNNVDIADLAVDGDGYITSYNLKQYCIQWGSYRIFADYWGSHSGNNDIYYNKMLFAENESKKYYKRLNQSTLLANGSVTVPDGNPLGENAYITTFPMVV